MGQCGLAQGAEEGGMPGAQQEVGLLGGAG